MQKTKRPLAAALICLSGASIWPAQADTAPPARQAIQAAYDRIDAAEARKDVEGNLSCYAPDFVGTLPNGQQVTLAQLRQTTTHLFAVARTIQATTTIQKLTLRGNAAQVTVKDHTAMTLADPRTGQAVDVVMDKTVLTTWVRIGRVWQEKRGRILSVKTTVDGQPAG